MSEMPFMFATVVTLMLFAITLMTVAFGASEVHRMDPMKMKKVFGVFLSFSASRAIHKALGW